MSASNRPVCKTARASLAQTVAGVARPALMERAGAEAHAMVATARRLLASSWPTGYRMMPAARPSRRR